MEKFDDYGEDFYSSSNNSHRSKANSYRSGVSEDGIKKEAVIHSSSANKSSPLIKAKLDGKEPPRRERASQSSSATFATSSDGGSASRFPQNEEVNKRAATYQILKNRGFSTQKPKGNSNPRVKQRKRYEKAVKKLKSCVRTFAPPKGHYIGESNGIRANVSKSVKFHY